VTTVALFIIINIEILNKDVDGSGVETSL